MIYDVLCAVTETQMNTQLWFCIKVNNSWSNLENISQISILAVHDLLRNTVKIR